MKKLKLKGALKPIGVVHVQHSDEEVSSSLNGVDGIVEVYPEYADGLKGIDGFSHIILLAYLHKVRSDQRKILVVRFRKFLRFGFKFEELPEAGVFASDSPVRPNPIAVSIVKLVGRTGRFLRVSGLDLFDGTPILDIKPYTPDRVINNYHLPYWYERFLIKVRNKLNIKGI
ncbi:MAG: tRNA (N6-threonylcarbamoyladenosine(37)-N6)-methyltransferase TrmO [archaeon GB-1867-005]|nr:tRNA (N6-threonylcarbamoyladenosine(37)-N6)-methyltransferase TrmO [Candidatus Culexmicrobium cathedralense]